MDRSRCKYRMESFEYSKNSSSMQIFYDDMKEKRNNHEKLN